MMKMVNVRKMCGRGYVPIRALFLVLITAASPISGETVKLKDGSVLRGQIISNTGESIILRTKDAEVKIDQISVESIDYSDHGKATVVLNDGSRLTGSIEEQNSETLALSTTFGILTLRKSDIKSIDYPRAEVPPVKPELPSDRVRAGLRAGYFAPIGQTMSNYGPAAGGAAFMEARFDRLTAGLDYTAAHFKSGDSGKALQISANRITLAYNFYFLGGPLSLSPVLGVGNAFLRSTERRVEFSALSSHYLENGDTPGLLISMLDSRGSIDKLVPAYYFLSRGDTIGYLISDQRNFTRERSGNAPLVSFGVGSAYTFKSGLTLGTQLSLTHLADRHALQFVSVAIEGSWKF